MIKNPQISVSRDIIGQEYVCETTRHNNITIKRNFEVWRGQLFAGMRLFNA